MMTKGSLLLQNIRHYFKKCQNVVMTSKFCHEIKNTSWCQKVCHEVKTCHDVRKFVRKFVIMMSKRKTSIMTLKSASWCHKVRHQDVTKFVMMTIGSSLLQKVRHEVKNISWCQKAIIKSKTRHDAKKFVMTSKKSWRQKFVIT